MELLSTNAGKVRREVLNGRSFLVAPVRMIVPGVLNGSQGALLYPDDEISRDPISWNGMPLTLGHPSEGGRNVSARSPSVFNGKTMGWVWNSFINGGNLDGEAWFDEDLTKRVSLQVHNLLLSEKPIELSTGLFTDNHPAAPGATHNGRAYQFVARNYRPDHLAVLLGQKGACSIEDGCGVNVNQECSCDGACEECKAKITNADPNQPRSKVSGYFKRYGSGTGKGPVHEAAQGGHLAISDKDRDLGADAARQLAEEGRNPPSWAIDEPTWERAKEAAAKNGHEEDWPYVVSIYQKMGGAMSGPAENQEGDDDMVLQQAQREALINELATNCSCWKGDKEGLGKLTDDRLQALKINHDESKGLTAVVNALKEKKGAATLTVNEMPAFIKEKIEAKEDKIKNKAKTKNAGEEEEDEEEDEKSMNKKIKNAKESDGSGWNDGDDNARAAAFARMREDGELSGNANAKTPQEWLASAPPEIRSAVVNAMKVERREREILVKALTANVGDSETKSRISAKLMTKPLDELQDLAALLPRTRSTPAANAERPVVTVPDWAGLVPAAPTLNAFEGEELPLPRMWN